MRIWKSFQREARAYDFFKNGRVVKFNRFFLKPHKIVDYRQKLYLSFTLSYFHCLATGELKFYMKQSGGAHICTTTWLWKICIFQNLFICHHHILTARKLGSIDSNNGGYYKNVINARLHDWGQVQKFSLFGRVLL